MLCMFQVHIKKFRFLQTLYIGSLMGLINFKSHSDFYSFTSFISFQCQTFIHFFHFSVLRSVKKYILILILKLFSWWHEKLLPQPLVYNVSNKWKGRKVWRRKLICLNLNHLFILVRTCLPDIPACFRMLSFEIYCLLFGFCWLLLLLSVAMHFTFGSHF